MNWRIMLLLYCSLAFLSALAATIPFLPGPSALARPAILLFKANQAATVLAILLLLPLGLIWSLVELRVRKRKDAARFNLAPVFLVCLSMTLGLSSIYLSDLARNHGRDHAIERAGAIVDALEAFKRTNGQYPDSLLNLVPDFLSQIPTPGIIASPSFEYQKAGPAFNLSFSQCVVFCFNFEVVSFNPLDAHVLEGESKQLYETGHDHWRYYIYD